ncbi:MAG: PepSY domain-containing protein [Burkholderiales bacterium]
MKSIHTATLARPHSWRFYGRHAALAGALSLGLALSPALADGKVDHDRVRAAVEAGEILPLPALLEQLQRSHPGQVLELELEKEDGRWIYEVKLLQADGRLLKLELDARSAQVLKLKQKGASEPGR